MSETLDKAEVRICEPLGKNLPMGHRVHRVGCPVYDHGGRSDQGEFIESINRLDNGGAMPIRTAPVLRDFSPHRTGGLHTIERYKWPSEPLELIDHPLDSRGGSLRRFTEEPVAHVVDEPLLRQADVFATTRCGGKQRQGRNSLRRIKCQMLRHDSTHRPAEHVRRGQIEMIENRQRIGDEITDPEGLLHPCAPTYIASVEGDHLTAKAEQTVQELTGPSTTSGFRFGQHQDWRALTYFRR